MQNKNPSKNPFIGLARWGQLGGWRWHVAALGAGWLTFVTSPPLAARQAASLKHVFLAGVLLLAGFVCAGMLLPLMHPLFYALGRLSGAELLSLFVALLNVWRYFKGRKVLKAVNAALSRQDAAQPAEEVAP